MWFNTESKLEELEGAMSRVEHIVEKCEAEDREIRSEEYYGMSDADQKLFLKKSMMDKVS